jgi:hypothetical protein
LAIQRDFARVLESIESATKDHPETPGGDEGHRPQYTGSDAVVMMTGVPPQRFSRHLYERKEIFERERRNPKTRKVTECVAPEFSARVH